MKNSFTAWEWVFIILAVAIAYAIISTYTAVLFFKIPTTSENQKLRIEVVIMTKDIAICMLTIIAMILGNKYKNSSNKNNDI